MGWNLWNACFFPYLDLEFWVRDQLREGTWRQDDFCGILD